MTTYRNSAHSDVEAVWREMRVPLLSFIGRRVSDRDVAEDILQDVMLRIHRHADELARVSAVSGWVHEIVRNAIIDHYRRAVVRRERPVGIGMELDGPTAASPEPGEAELRAELAVCLEPLLAQLPARYGEAIRLTDLEGLSQAEAAARVGLSTSGMKSRVQRGRAQLRELFSRCCEIEFDRRGGVIDYQPHHGGCDCERQFGAGAGSLR